VSRVQWLGVQSTDVVGSGSDDDQVNGWLSLSQRDRKMAQRMMCKEVFQEGGFEPSWRRELQVMLMLNTKGEIQIMGNGIDLERWLDTKLCAGSRPAVPASQL